MTRNELRNRLRPLIVELTAIYNELGQPGEGSTFSPAPKTDRPPGRIRPVSTSVSPSQANLLKNMIKERWRGADDVRDRAFSGQFGCGPDDLPAEKMNDAMAWLKNIPRLHEGVARG